MKTASEVKRCQRCSIASPTACDSDRKGMGDEAVAGSHTVVRVYLATIFRRSGFISLNKKPQHENSEPSISLLSLHVMHGINQRKSIILQLMQLTFNTCANISLDITARHQRDMLNITARHLGDMLSITTKCLGNMLGITTRCLEGYVKYNCQALRGYVRYNCQAFRGYVKYNYQALRGYVRYNHQALGDMLGITARR